MIKRDLFGQPVDVFGMRVSFEHEDIWIDNAVQFDSSGRRAMRPTGMPWHTTSHVNAKKTILFFLFVGAIFFVLLGRLFLLQITDGDAYRAIAEGNRQRVVQIPAERGLVFDVQGMPLTQNIPRFSLVLVPQDLPRDPEKRTRAVSSLAEITHQKEEDVKALLETYGAYSYESIVMQEDLDYETALAVHIAAADLPGISVQRGSKRLYLHDVSETRSAQSLSHVVGYLGKMSPEDLQDLYEEGYIPSDTIGKTGVERTYERALRGTPGKKRIEVNAFGREQTVLAEQPPIAGVHLGLTIDARMQAALEAAIENGLRSIGATRAAGIALDPRSGAIRALVSVPSFDNNDFSGGISKDVYTSYLENSDHPLFARAIGGTYPSGSTIKPAIAAAALEEGVIRPNDTIVSTGGIRVGPWFFPDWLAGGHGVTDVRKSIAQSINTFYYYIGGGFDTFVGLGVDRIVYHLKRFGFSERLGIDIPGEAAGFLPTKEWKLETKGEPWYVGDTYNLSIGQGDLLATPLQIANMTATVANGGTVFRPHVGGVLINPKTGAKDPIGHESIRDSVFQPTHLEIVRLGMRDCVTYGSCQRLSLLPITSAGKTGTAQWHSEKKTHAWFTSFAPFEQPEIVVTILVEEGGEGGVVASKIAYEFYREWVRLRQN